jgi:hypothetical protein
MELLHCVEQALKAHTLYRLDHQYVVQDGEVIIVDDFTGRLMKGRRWSDGLHQAVEAKEDVKIERENQTLATITLQNYFRLYEKLSGMTGTAETEAQEFWHTYNSTSLLSPHTCRWFGRTSRTLSIEHCLKVGRSYRGNQRVLRQGSARIGGYGVCREFGTDCHTVSKGRGSS